MANVNIFEDLKYRLGSGCTILVNDHTNFEHLFKSSIVPTTDPNKYAVDYTSSCSNSHVIATMDRCSENCVVFKIRRINTSDEVSMHEFKNLCSITISFEAGRWNYEITNNRRSVTELKITVDKMVNEIKDRMIETIKSVLMRANAIEDMFKNN